MVSGFPTGSKVIGTCDSSIASTIVIIFPFLDSVKVRCAVITIWVLFTLSKVCDFHFILINDFQLLYLPAEVCVLTGNPYYAFAVLDF